MLSQQLAASRQQPATVVTEAKKPEFVIRSHPKRSNLVSIITQEEEIEKTLFVLQPRVPTPPAPLPPLKVSSPPPGPPTYGRRSPPWVGGLPARPSYYRSRSRSRSFERARSPLSPRRWSPTPRRWSRSPPLRGRSPLPTGRWSPPPRRSPLRQRRSPASRRSPLKRSPRLRSPHR